jgi:predicted transcriptional regulator
MNDAIEVEALPVKRKGGRPRGVKRAVKKLSQGELATLVLDYAKGLPQREIAQKMGISDAAVTQVLEKFKPAFSELMNVEEYRKAKASIIESVQLQTLKSMADPEKHASAHLGHLSAQFDILNKHGRLERGQSTANVQQSMVTVAISPTGYED